MAAQSFILDNGAYSLKAGFSTDIEPRIIPNCITRYEQVYYININ